MTHDGRQKLLRSKFRESSLRLSFDWTNSKSPNDSFPSPNHESVEAIPQEMLNLYKAHRGRDSSGCFPYQLTLTCETQIQS
jgi:hypothetical protein